MRPKRFLSILAISVAMVLVVSTAAQAQITAEKVIGGPGNQLRLFGNGTWYVWSSNSQARPKHYDAFARLVGGTDVIKLNASKTEGFSGNFDPGTNTVVYQQISGGTSDIYPYDLDTSTRTKVSGASSSSLWEWEPRISSSYLLFNIDRYVHGGWQTSLVILNRNTQATKRIGKWIEAKTFELPGGVGETYATFTTCGKVNCSVFVYTIAGGQVRRVPVPSGKIAFAGVVDETGGVLYFMRSGLTCGSSSGLWSLPVTSLTDVATKLAVLPRGEDADILISLAPDPVTLGGVDVLFDHVVCSTLKWDAYRFPNVNV
jgi:hypothetical protein